MEIRKVDIMMLICCLKYQRSRRARSSYECMCVKHTNFRRVEIGDHLHVVLPAMDL